jgi:phosphoribosylaminoimidazole carboxylase PurE protein
MACKVAVVMGSDSDLPIMKEAIDALDQFGIKSFVSITSAHRTPDKVKRFLKEVTDEECEVIIAAAGGAAHLAGVIAAQTTIPVIGVPMSSALSGIDSLYSMVQMPQGIPVGTMAVGKPGAVNAAIFAAEIIAIKDKAMKNRLARFKKELAEKVNNKDRQLRKKGIKKFLEEKNKSRG